MLTGNNGILTQANKAKDETEQGTLEEEVRLKVNERETDKYIGGERSLEEYLKEIEGASVEKLIEDAYLVKRGEAEVTVYEDGDIEKGKVEIWDGESTEVPEIKEFNWNIYNGAQLKFLADFVNNGNKLTEEQKVQVAEEGYQESDIVLNENTTVNLMNNIDLGARQENGELTSGTQWEPIGISSYFVGNFEGNNYSIKGIYVKQSGVWVLIVSFDNNIETHSVIFQLNDSLDEPANMPSGSLMAYQIPHGSYFAAQEGYSIPIPTRNGYDFVGWYTTKTITPTSGKFTDLTPVMADLTLYAIWEKQV